MSKPRPVTQRNTFILIKRLAPTELYEYKCSSSVAADVVSVCTSCANDQETTNALAKSRKGVIGKKNHHALVYY